MSSQRARGCSVSPLLRPVLRAHVAVTPCARPRQNPPGWPAGASCQPLRSSARRPRRRSHVASAPDCDQCAGWWVHRAPLPLLEPPTASKRDGGPSFPVPETPLLLPGRCPPCPRWSPHSFGGNPAHLPALPLGPATGSESREAVAGNRCPRAVRGPRGPQVESTARCHPACPHKGRPGRDTAVGDDDGSALQGLRTRQLVLAPGSGRRQAWRLTFSPLPRSPVGASDP